MLNLSLSKSRSSLSSNRSTSTSSTATSSSSRLSFLLGFRHSYESDLKRNNPDSYQCTPASTLRNYAEDMDEDNVAWGPVSRRKKHS